MADKSQLVRIVLDTGHDEGSRILALVEEDYAQYLAWYYELGTFKAAVLALADRALEKGDGDEAAKHRQFFLNLCMGRILILHRTFGGGK